ncbi:MAG TPA: ACP S-malonyltransferase [Acidimicrobiia bacterium]|nr:ACP S-malonyltransferase [Acidimicrobiia bacterium]
MSVAILFPGQGSQFVGMGAELFDQRPDLLGDAADEVLGWSLRELCLEGPEESLTRTEHAQVALFAVSYALWVEFRQGYRGAIAGAAGHSLGEYTALCAAEAMSFPEALRVVARRGEAMAQAADLEASGMAALIGADAGLAVEMASNRQSDGGRLEVANINAPGQVVVAGSRDDIEWLVENGRDLGMRRVLPLKVAGAFHSRFMEPAAEEVSQALSQITFAAPSFPVWSNTTARPHQPEEIQDTLTSQVVSTVRFEESLLDMAATGMDTFVHIGPGDVTAGMAKRTVEGIEVHVISEVADIPAVADSLVTVT